jgi:hypothetical protein
MHINEIEGCRGYAARDVMKTSAQIAWDMYFFEGEIDENASV